MKLSHISIYAALAALSILSACKKDPEPTPAPAAPTNGTLGLEFNAVAGNSDLVLTTQTYTNGSSETFTVSKFNYYISNVKLTHENGTVFAEEDSYHLVQKSVTGSEAFVIKDVPGGNYTKLTFTIGVDSMRCVNGAGSGALDSKNGMYWVWNTGYIMAKLEGTSPKAAGGTFMYHIGGFTGETKTMRTITLTLPEKAMVSAKTNPEIHLKTDVLKWFSGANTISIQTTGVIHMPGADAKKIADNYSASFSIEEVHNH